MINPLRFGAITVARMKNAPRSFDRAITQQAVAKFQEGINAHLKQLETQHQGEAEYYAAVIPSLWWDQMLIVDGPEFDQFGRDSLRRQQRNLKAMETIAKTQTRNPLRFDKREDFETAPTPQIYNWCDAYALNIPNINETATGLDRFLVSEYLGKATQYLDIEV